MWISVGENRGKIRSTSHRSRSKLTRHSYILTRHQISLMYMYIVFLAISICPDKRNNWLVNVWLLDTIGSTDLTSTMTITLVKLTHACLYAHTLWTGRIIHWTRFMEFMYLYCYNLRWYNIRGTTSTTNIAKRTIPAIQYHLKFGHLFVRDYSSVNLSLINLISEIRDPSLYVDGFTSSELNQLAYTASCNFVYIINYIL